ncbi:MAG: YbbR-like domain-containing protein [Balneolaceae bacterium]|nr:YbbR-like domain-containing protein [Balneolaceae bacterium]
MSENNFSQISERFLNFWNQFLKRVDEEGTADYSREKIIVFIIAILLALCLWLLVNLSRAYVLNVNLPIELGNIPDDMALAEDLPDFATASVQGEGWKLLNIYNNPPRIFVDVTSGEVNLYDQVQQQMNAIPDLDVQKVQPLILSLDLEERISRRVPVEPRINVDFSQQFGFVGAPSISPDSITVTGAASLVRSISSWQTDSVTLENIRSVISTTVSLEEPERLVSLSTNEIQYNANVAEYTEGDARVFIRTRNLPAGQNITFSPPFLTVRYTLPIEEYAEIEDLNPFTAYVPYSMITEDSTGFVAPRIEVSTDEYHIRIVSKQPEKVSYFEVVGG